MNPDEMIRAAARVLDMNFDPAYKPSIANELFTQLWREYRERAERMGIGLDSELTQQRITSLEELLGRKLTRWELLQVIAGQIEAFEKRHFPE